MTTAQCNEPNLNEENAFVRDEQGQRNLSTNSSTTSSSRGDKQFQFTQSNSERSGQNSRTSSLAESTAAASRSINDEGFSNAAEIIQHLRTVWFDHNTHDGPRRLASTSTAPPTNHSNRHETGASHHAKGHPHAGPASQSQYNHHQSGQQQHYQYAGQQHWNSYNNPRRGGTGGYARNYNAGNNDPYWNQKGNRFASYRSMNNLMNNPTNYQQQQQQQQPQSSPPTQRRQGEPQPQPSAPQPYYKKNRSEHERRPNGYTAAYQQPQQTSDYPSNNSGPNNAASEQSSISSTQSYPSHLDSYNR